MKTESPQPDFPAFEEEVLSNWKEHKTFEKSLEIRKDGKAYMFYDGPPFATGTPHYGHLLAGTLKDIVPRYQTMKGRYVERRFGWDTHGLPIEMLTEKELGLNGRLDILEYGIAEFNEACRAGVMRYVKEWETVTNRLGRWIDFEDDYKTMDFKFMDSVWWVFKQLWDNGRIYEGKRIVPYSWRLATPLSNFEASSNYKMVQDPAITVRFRLKDSPEVSILAWTTTPWTLPSNQALCVGPDIEYSHIKTKDEELIIATERLQSYFKNESQYEVLKTLKGKELEGKAYQPLFDFFSEKEGKGAFIVLTDDYVSTEDGTGIVHQAPDHGEDDYRICTAAGIEIVDAVDEDGNFRDSIPNFAGQNVKAADKNIITVLKEAGLLFKQETLNHSYPFCDRSDTPLIYKSISAWFVKVEDIQEQMLENNSRIHWVPEHLKEGRFGKWLAGARDWNISRNRFWGNPLPIWRCDSCEELECIGSAEELESKCGSEVADLHKHFVDELNWPCEKCGGSMKRIPEVLDCWFESGSMPYAQVHYPFENKERFEASFPADYIAEGIDQTRGWYYTLMVLSTSLFGKEPFKNVVVNGTILAEDGKKMSKRLKNYPDPMEVINKYGADALRLYLIKSPAVRAENLRLSETGIKEIVRSVMLPFWNAYSFLTTYANIDGYQPKYEVKELENELDRWIVSRTQSLLAEIEQQMNEYKLYAVVPALLEFLEELTNWYVRRSRRRFWSDDADDKQKGYDALRFALSTFAKALAPFLPFLTERIYKNLCSDEQGTKESVHLEDYPVADESLIDKELENAMALIQHAVSLGRTLRARLDLKVRQPLASLTVVTRDETARLVLETYGHHIKEELNVKEVLFSADEDSIVDRSIKPNYPKCGPIFGKRMKEFAAELGKLSADQFSALEDGQELEVLGEKISSEHLDIRRSAKGGQELETESGVTVFFDTALSEELVKEGHARELVNRVQRMRKEANFNISDRINLGFETESGELLDAIKHFSDYIKEETLGVELGTSVVNEKDIEMEHEVNEFPVKISLQRRSA